jgi:hypothetical protein
MKVTFPNELSAAYSVLGDNCLPLKNIFRGSAPLQCFKSGAKEYIITGYADIPKTTQIESNFFYLYFKIIYKFEKKVDFFVKIISNGANV